MKKPILILGRLDLLRSFLRGLLCLGVSWVAGPVAQAVDYNSAGSGNWSTPANWTPNGNPNPTADNVTIGNGTNITVDAGIPAPSSAATIFFSGTTGIVTGTGVLNTVNIDTSNDAVLSVTGGGTLNVTGNILGGSNTGTTNNNVINVTGTGSTISTTLNGSTQIGYQKNATLNVTNGGTFTTTVTGAGQVIIGDGATGILNVDGAGSTFVANVGPYTLAQGEIAVSVGKGTATGTVSVTNGGTFTMGATQDVYNSNGAGNPALMDATGQRTLYIGRDTGSTGTFNVGTSPGVGGGTVTNNGGISVGDRGTGTFNMYDGTVTTGLGVVAQGGDMFVGGYMNGGFFPNPPIGNAQTFNRNMIARLSYLTGPGLPTAGTPNYVNVLHQTGTVFNAFPIFPPWAPDPGGGPTWNQPVTTGTGVFNMSGGTMNIGGVLWAGAMRGSVGTINVTGGTLNITGQFLQQDPLFFPTSTSTAIRLGEYGKGIYNQTGGTVTTGVSGSGGDISVSYADNIATNGTGSATSLTISGGTLNVGGTIFIGADASENGTSQGLINFDGGTVFTNAIQYGWGGGLVNYNGTVLKANIDTLNFLNGSNVANSEILAGNGGAIFDTNGHAVTINSVLDGPGVLTKQGAGTLTFTNSQQYTGATNVNNGTLLYGTNDVIATGVVNVNRISGSASAILDMGLDRTDTVGTVTLGGVFSGGRIDGTGTSTLTTTGTFEMQNGTVTAGLGGAGIALNKTTTGTVTLSGTNSYTGLTTVSAGTLRLNNSASSNTTILTDGVNATTDILINGGTLLLAASEQIGNTARINMTSGAMTFSGSGRTETIGSLTNSGGTLTTGANTIIGLGSITWSGGTNTINTGGLISDKHWVITGGTNTVQAGGTLLVEVGGGTADMHFGGTASPTITLNSSAGPGDAGRILLRNDIYVDASLTSGTAQILNGGALANPGFIDMDGGIRTYDINNGLASSDMRISARIQNGGMTKTNTGTLELTGDNTFADSTTIDTNGGTLLANGVNTLGGTSDITVNSGGTLLLDGADGRVNDSANIILNGGVLSIAGVSGSLSNATEQMGVLTLTANSAIFFGSGDTNRLIFTDFVMNGFTLAVYGWSGFIYAPYETVDHGPASQDRIEFLNNPVLSGTDLGNISFYNDTGAWIGTALEVDDGPYFEIVPVPEPSTVIGALGLVGLVGYRERRRLGDLSARLVEAYKKWKAKA